MISSLSIKRWSYLLYKCIVYTLNVQEVFTLYINSQLKVKSCSVVFGNVINNYILHQQLIIRI